jgi:hypothetical protein
MRSATTLSEKLVGKGERGEGWRDRKRGGERKKLEWPV